MDLLIAIAAVVALILYIFMLIWIQQTASESRQTRIILEQILYNTLPPEKQIAIEKREAAAKEAKQRADRNALIIFGVILALGAIIVVANALGIFGN